MRRTVLPLLFASTLCVSCGDAAIAPSQSLVGAKELPSATALADETLYITRGGGAYGGDALSYELRPDNSLLITNTFSDRHEAGEIVRGKETLHIAPGVAAEVRQLLWRLRPAKLKGVEQDTRPTGCEREGLHDFGELTVGFVNEGDARGIEDDQVGIFALPTADSCNTSAAVEARSIVRRAPQLLPRSDVASDYERAG
jgi:hypothetical protein